MKALLIRLYDDGKVKFQPSYSCVPGWMYFAVWHHPQTEKVHVCGQWQAIKRLSRAIKYYLYCTVP